MPPVRSLPAEHARAGLRMRAVHGVQIALLLAVAVFCASTVPAVRARMPPGFVVPVDGWLQGAAYVLTALLAALRVPGSERYWSVWAWFAAALAARAVAFLAYLAHVRWQDPLPYPSIADVGWLVSGACMMIGLVALVRASHARLTASLALDGIIGGLAVAAISLAVLEQTLQALTAPGTPLAVIVTNVAYPVIDLALLLVIVGVLVAYRWRPPLPVWALGAGVVGFAVLDGTFLFQAVAGTFRPGTPLSALSLVATALIAAAGWLPERSGQVDRWEAIPSLVMPGLFGFACVGLFVYATTHRVPAASVALASAGLAVALVRTGLAFRALGHVAERRREALLQAQKAEALGQLAGGIAHDFNNLLTAQLGYAEQLREAVRDRPEAVADLEHLIAVSRRAAALVSQLLSFSRGRTDVAVAPVPVGEAVAGLGDLLGHVVGPSVVLDLDLAPDAGHVEVNRDQLEQVVVNLATNARDALPAGGRLVIGARLVPAREAAGLGLGAADHVALSAADDGTGMDAGTIERALDPFFTTKGPGEGTGLGLATVDAFARNAGGRVRIESAPGVGTTVTLLLPRCAAPAWPGPDGIDADPAPTAGPVAPGQTVLLVEDQLTVRALLGQVLRQQGYAVVDASNGVEALTELVRVEQHIDLVVTDVVMPQIDGPALVEELRGMGEDAAVLMMSGYAEEDRLTQLELPGVAFLQKPFGAAEFVEKVREVLATSGRP